MFSAGAALKKQFGEYHSDRTRALHILIQNGMVLSFMGFYLDRSMAIVECLCVVKCRGGVLLGVWCLFGGVFVSSLNREWSMIVCVRCLSVGFEGFM